jgi:mannose-6-phosphate isomerase-like protein (cupin superfamily)
VLMIPLCFCAFIGAHAADLHPGEQPGTATLIHRTDILPDRSSTQTSQKHLWQLYSSPDARMNYFEVTSRTSLHFHPDADHRLYVLEGKVVITAGTNVSTAVVGDLIVIPKGVRHCYDVPAKGDRALLLTFDAPPYDPRKTVNLEPSSETTSDELTRRKTDK